MKSNKIRKYLKRFFINIFMSGKYRGARGFGMSDYLVRYGLMNFIIIFGIGILVVFTVSNLKVGRYSTALVCIGMTLVGMTSFVMARTKIRQYIPALILMIFYGLLCVMVTWTGRLNGTFMFIYMYPSLTIIMLGMRFGVILSSILIALVTLEMVIPVTPDSNFPFEFTMRMLVNYFLVFFVMVVIETTRKTKDRLIENQNKKLHELREEAETANRTKSNFLASMSHEIRTPMNAISGMAELLMRRELPGEARGEVQDIKQAANNLISIINDILDFSKIEAGKMEIIPVKYMLSSLVNDTINIIHMRLMEKPIRFLTNIDGHIPNNLFGDEIRFRQILLNLLSNAVKYTDKGVISLSIIMKEHGNGHVLLEVSVTDTGKGMKPEDLDKLFGDFVQVDTKKNRGIEGTGLGLAITKKLCEAMGGTINVESVYGKGSRFKVVLPQDYDSDVPFASVEEPQKKKVLVFEGRTVYTQSVCWSLKNMGIPFIMTETLEDFSKALLRYNWYYIFTGYGLYNKVKPLLEKAVFPNGKRPHLALMVEWEDEAQIPNVRFISLPAQSLSIANVLNGKTDSRSYYSNQTSGLIRYTYPEARLLVVDDIATNLKVAEGLLSPYRAKIDTALNGNRAIDLVKQHKYDIVFMDHMMPGMDGIEATGIIRDMEEDPASNRAPVPIVALTANAISGMREMFLEKGFNDFLAKPIDVSKLDEMLDRWIPKEKRKKKSEVDESGSGELKKKNEELGMRNETNNPSSNSSSSLIPGVDIQKGISMTGGTMELYRQVVGLFHKDAEDRLPMLQNVPDKDSLPGFITQVHALKSASASVGAADVSARAAKLEAAGKAVDLAFIKENLPAFAKQLAELIEGIKAWENVTKEKDAPNRGNVSPTEPHSGVESTTGVSPLDKAEVTKLLQELAVALESKKADDIDNILEELTQQAQDPQTKEAIDKISDSVLMTEFDSAAEIVQSLLKG